MRTAIANMLAAMLSTVTVTTLFYILLSSDFTMTTMQSKPIPMTTTIAKHNTTTSSNSVGKMIG